jgi:glucosamine--fructose-6-phosphate aminotransferase (isomerizing)
VIFLEDREMAVIMAAASPLAARWHHHPQKAHHHHLGPVSAVRGNIAILCRKRFTTAPIDPKHPARRINLVTGQVSFEELSLTPEQAQAIDRIFIVACGTSHYAGQVGRFFIEKLGRVKVSVDYASEFRYRDPLVDDQTVILSISQSGETVDTLAAMEEGRSKGAQLWSIVNVQGSMVHKMSHGSILMKAGPEIGWPAPKPLPPP